MTTSSLFNITTDVGNVQCANWLQIKPPETKTANPVAWETPYARFAAGNFNIRIGNKRFYGTEPVLVRSDPGIHHTTLETVWQEHGVEMRMFLYFRKTHDNTKWELYEIRTYNGQPRGDWIYFRTVNGENLAGEIGQANGAQSLRFIPTTGNYDAEITCEDCSLEAFLLRTIPVSPFGYMLEPRIGLPKMKRLPYQQTP